jgi:hypothetical protein
MAGKKMGAWDNRIVGHGEESPDQLLANPLNWRIHTKLQQAVLTDELEGVGWVQTVTVNQRTGHMVDGHLRVELALTAGAPMVPVTYVDLSDSEEKRVLATLDPIGAMAMPDPDKLDQLLQGIEEVGENTKKMLGDVAERAGLYDDADPKGPHLGALRDKFIVPPFTVLDARQGYWKQRKEAWKALGYDSAAGREGLQDTANTSENKVSYLTGFGPAMGGSAFDPVLAELVYRWFNVPGGTVLDPFCGECTKGIVAASLGYEYTGVDVRKEQVVANAEQANKVGVEPTFLHGDAAELAKVLPKRTKYDLVFTSPPYYDLEVYSKDEKDGSAFATYEGFMDWYTDIFKAAAAKLRDHRFLVVKVGDVRASAGGYRCFVADTIKRFCTDVGLHLFNEAVLVTPLGSLPIRVSGFFGKGRKLGKAHQNLLVFYKGDIAAINSTYPEEVEHGDSPVDQ